jgi:uncharacterized phage protein gp47/JayE
MSGSITLPTPPVCTIDATGIHAPSFTSIQNYFTTGYQAIYGADVYLGNDSQDGELVGFLSTSYNDVCAQAVACYNSFSPSTAQGVGLSSNVKINNMRRKVPTNSEMDITVVGNAGIPLTNAVVSDGTNSWTFSTTIPISGSIIVTAICNAPGAIVGPPIGTVLTMSTPTNGWQSATVAAATSVGQPVEMDVQLRQRQAVSTETPEQTTVDNLQAQVLALSGVQAVSPYENATSTTDANGVPRNSIAFVVQGGIALQIAQTIQLGKSIGCGTYGTTSETVTDVNGLPQVINFFRPSAVALKVVVTIHPLPGYNSVIGSNIQASIANYLGQLPIGQSVFLTRLYVPAQLQGPYAITNNANDPNTFELESVTITRSATTTLTSNITNSQTTIPVASAANFPSAGQGQYIIQIGTEQMLVTGGNGTLVWTVQRGYNATTPASALLGATVTGEPSATDISMAFFEQASILTSNITIATV